MAKIFITGLCATTMGKMEEQLGNAAIVISMMKLLHRYIPGAEIVSNIQMSHNFCAKYGLTSIRDKNLYSWGRRATLISIFNYIRSCVWRFISNITGLNFKFLIKGKMLKEYLSADIILDLNGDIYSEYLHWWRFIKHSADILSARNLNIAVVEFASSPGPFKSPIKRKIAKFFFKQLTVISNREPVSTAILMKLGVNKPPVVSACCPAFHLDPCLKKRAIELLSRENIKVNDRPLVGVCIAGTNMKNIYKAEPDELLCYVPTLKYLLEDIKATVILIPHVYRTNPYTGEHIHGPDNVIAQQLYQAVGGDKYSEQLKVIEGIFTPSEAKGIFGQLDLFMSGRMHAAIGALSQSVPTVILGYGHKQYGMTKLLKIEKFIYGGKDPDRILSIVKAAWENRKNIHETLKITSLKAKELAELNFIITRDILSLEKELRNNLPADMIDKWVACGAPSDNIDLSLIFSDISIPH